MPPAAAYWRPWPGGGTRDLREDHPMGFHGFMDFMDFMDPIWIYIKKINGFIDTYCGFYGFKMRIILLVHVGPVKIQDHRFDGFIHGGS